VCQLIFDWLDEAAAPRWGWFLATDLFLAGWVNRQQQDVINHLRIENEILKEKLGKKRILLNDDQRRRLAVSGKVLGRKMLEEVGTLFTPDTILRWHRVLVAKKFDYSDRRKPVGRPRAATETQPTVGRRNVIKTELPKNYWVVLIF
jgi:putative transposase